MSSNIRQALDGLLVKRFFYAPSFQIYGGVAGLFDFGPPGCALQNNILSIWRKHFVLEEEMLEIECTNLTPESVLKTSGHVDRFTDQLVKDSVTDEVFRADHLVKQVLSTRLKNKLAPEVEGDYNLVLETLDNYQGTDLLKLMNRLEIKSPEGNSLTDPVPFNLMFETQIGPSGQFRGFLRPETAQGHFINFKKLLEFNTESMPFASASIGKSFRNEISPRQGLLRVREFTMAEIEHYVDPLNKSHERFNEVKHVKIPLYSKSRQLEAAGTIEMTIGEAVSTGIVNNETLGYFIARIYLFLLRIGIKSEKLRFRQHMENEMAHYACDCWDAEIESSYGWIESVGCADRSAYDLTAHSLKTKEKLIVRERLETPSITEALVLEVNRKVFGPAFRQNAKFVQGYIDTLGSEDDWKQDEVSAMKNTIETDGKIIITGTDGNPYTLTKELISISKKTIKKNNPQSSVSTLPAFRSVREYTPNVIEPSFGIGRILYALLEHSFSTRKSDINRAVLSFPPSVAPTKCLIVPLSNNMQFNPVLKKVAAALRQRGMSSKIDDSATSIGRRYARNDELGTPFAVTVDFQTLEDDTITLRERDSTRQIRQSFTVIVDLITDLVEERICWADVLAKYPLLEGTLED